MSLKVFVDFDGTVTKEDVGNAFFRRYAGQSRYDALLVEYKAERMSARQCFREGISAIGRVNREEAAGFVRDCAIDPHFASFVSFCRDHDIGLTIVSDGLSFYINEILDQHGMADVQVFSNVLEFGPAGHDGLSALDIRFPYADVECQRCACCKRNMIVTHAGEDDIIIYVGEGYSDRCPVQYADIVFAKDQLQTFCQQKNISYFLYESFRDVTERLQILLSRKKLRKRVAAERMRRELFVREP